MKITEKLPDDPKLSFSSLRGIWIPAEILFDFNLTPQEKLLAALIWNMDHKENICYASNKWFAERMSLSEKTIANMLMSLKKKGYIKQETWNGYQRRLKYIKNTSL